MLILKENAANAVPTPPAGKDTFFIDDSGTPSVKNAAGSVTTFPTTAASNAQVLFMNGTALTGDADFVWNYNTNVLTIAGNIGVTNLKTDNLLYANGVPWDLQQAGGSNTQIQFNDADSFGGSAAFTFNKTSNVITASGNINANNFNATTNITAGNVYANSGLISAQNLKGEGGNISNIQGANVSGAVATATNAGTVTTAAQPNITSLGNLTALVMAGNITPTADETYDLGNATNRFKDLWLSGNSIRLGGAVISANATAVTITNPQGGNTSFTGSTTSNNSSIVNGTSNVVAAASGNVTTSVNGTANVFTVTSTGANVAGYANITGNANVGNLGAAQVLASANVTAPQLISNVSTGTAPFVVTSTTRVANLDVAKAGVANTVNDAAQPNITSVGTLTSLGVSGAVTASTLVSNVSTGTAPLTVTSTTRVANLDVAKAGVANTVNDAAQPNITSVGTLTSLGVSGTITAANITANTGVFTGNAAGLNNIPGGNIVGNISGNISNANYAAFAGQVVDSAQSNITSVGTLSSLTVSGNASAGNLNTAGKVVASTLESNVATGTAPFVVASTTRVANLDVAKSGIANTVNDAAQPNITSVGTLTSLGVSGTITAANITANTGVFTGNGAGLTNVPGGNISGQTGNALVAGTVYTNSQPNITSVGTLTSLAVTGNATAGNVYANAGTIGASLLTGTLTTASQPNITSVGVLSSLTATGNVAAGNLTTTGILSVTGTGVSSIAGNLDMTSNTIINLANPTNDQDAATKYYVDSVAQGLHVHDSCYVATTGTLDAASGGTVSYNNGSSGVGATLTTTGTYLLIDGGNVQTVGTRILVKNEANAAWNGIYTYTSTTVLTRATDFDTSAEAAGGDFLFVTSGTVNADTGWVQTTDNPTLGTSNIVFTQFSGAGTYTAGTGLTLTGTVFSVNASQTQVTSVGTLTGLAVNGNITAANITANTGVFTGNGSGLSQLAGGNVTGQVGNALVAGTVYTASQPNITSVGTLTSLGVSGAVTASTLVSNVATGTAPLTVTSTTRVANLNVATAGVANTVNDAAQPNITSVGTLSSLGVSGTITAANITANTGVFTGNGSGLTNLPGGNISGQTGNALVAGTVYTNAQPNITSVGSLTTLTVTGNANVGNIGTAQVLATANVTAPTLISNVATGTAPLTVTSTTRVANLNVATAGIANTVNDAAQPNITSVGTLSSLTVTGTTTSGNFATAGNLTASFIVSNVATGTAPFTVSSTTRVANLNVNYANVADFDAVSVASTGTFYPTFISGSTAGNYAAQTNAAFTFNAATGAFNATLLGGTLSTAAQPNVTSLGTLTSLGVSGTITAANITANTGVFTGNGSGLSQLAGANVVGTINSTTLGNSSLFVGTTSIALNRASASQSLTGITSIDGFAATVSTAAQPNITSVGTLTSLNVSGNITAPNVIANTGYHFRSVNAAVSAAGTVQGNATAIAREVNVVSTVASGAGVVLPTAVAGMCVHLINTAANALLVYPASGGKINALATDAAFTIPASSNMLQFIAISATQWYTTGATYA